MTDIDPNIKVLIDTLRSGKSEAQALQSYCWAKMAVPVHVGNGALGQPRRDPFDSPPGYPDMAMARAVDAFRDGKDDAGIQEAFRTGMREDQDRGIVWRVAMKSERPSFSDLVRELSLDDQMRASRIFGVKAVAEAIARGAPE